MILSLRDSGWRKKKMPREGIKIIPKPLFNRGFAPLALRPCSFSSQRLRCHPLEMILSLRDSGWRKKKMPREGIEPPTQGFSVLRSTD
jgi:hypothetical protein